MHHTGRHEVLVFKGGYHGGVLAFGGGEPSPVTVPHAFVLGDYDDVDGTRALIREHAELGRDPRRADARLRRLHPGLARVPARCCARRRRAAGALLIFDEVMTSRLARRRAGLEGVAPDLMTVGKYLAGGMSFGAFGGRRDLMAGYDPTRPGALFHAGTFNNNVLSMSAGIAGLDAGAHRRRAARPQRARRPPARGAQPRGGGGRRAVHASGPRLADDDPPEQRSCKRLLFFELLDSGQWIAARGMIALSLPVTDEQCDAFAAAVGAILTRHAELSGDADAEPDAAHPGRRPHPRADPVSGELAPGERIIETELAAELGVSRHTLRSALQTLTFEGLLEQSQFKSTHVARPTARDVFETYTLRNALEAMACRLAAERRPPPAGGDGRGGRRGCGRRRTPATRRR